MSPTAHGLISWLISQPLRHRRERCIVTYAGLVPDIDGLGWVVDQCCGTQYFVTWHHVLAHNLWFALLCMAGAAYGAQQQKGLTVLLVGLAFHVHLLCDVLGSGSGDGYPWPILYLYPFADVGWSWSGQWVLNGWQNWLIAGITMCWVAVIMRRTSRSIFEIFGERFDQAARRLYERIRSSIT